MAAIYTDQVTAKASNSEPPTGSFKKSSFEKGLFLPSLGNWKRQPNNNNKNLLTSSCPTPTKHQQKKKNKNKTLHSLLSQWCWKWNLYATTPHRSTLWHLNFPSWLCHQVQTGSIFIPWFVEAVHTLISLLDCVGKAEEGANLSFTYYWKQRAL